MQTQVFAWLKPSNDAQFLLRLRIVVDGNSRRSRTQRISIDEGAYLKGSVNIQKEAPKKEVLGGIALSPSEAAQPRKR